MRVGARIAIVLLVLCVAPPAMAIPRFAARSGNECIQCHVSPSGGGMRNSYGRNVFEIARLPLAPAAEEVPSAARPEPTDEEGASSDEDADVSPVFSPELTPTLALGGDFRLAYIWIRPDRSPKPGQPRDVTNSFFLMQGQLYFGAELHDHLTFLLSEGVYAGFEAWGLFRAAKEPAEDNLLVKVGHFMPAFGVREVEHQLFTRQWVGLGNADRDTGVEITAYTGPLTTTVSLLNGTLGSETFDTHGTERRTFEKAFVARMHLRHDHGWLRTMVGGSFYYDDDVATANPMFAAGIPQPLRDDVTLGLNEIRTGPFLSLNVGRLTYVADFVYVSDDFESGRIAPRRGFAHYQELSFVPLQGLELISTFEFMDPDVELLNNTSRRTGFAVEFFPWPFTEFRAMVRRLEDETSPTGGAWDLVLFTHLFL